MLRCSSDQSLHPSRFHHSIAFLTQWLLQVVTTALNIPFHLHDSNFVYFRRIVKSSIIYFNNNKEFNDVLQFGLNLSKDPKVRISSWNNKLLSEDQLMYAATDAYVSLRFCSVKSRVSISLFCSLVEGGISISPLHWAARLHLLTFLGHFRMC